MGITSKVDICNLALGHLGNYGSVSNIDTPNTQKEIVFSLWYDITRQHALKLCIPNFARSRRLVAAAVVTPAFGYTNVFEYPSDCLKVLGLGNIEDLKDYEYTVEENYILTEDDWSDGLQLRFIKDVTDVGEFSPEFKIVLSWMLAANVALEITQDPNKKKLAEEMALMKVSELSGMNAQENKPIRISNSLAKAARDATISRNPYKK